MGQLDSAGPLYSRIQRLPTATSAGRYRPFRAPSQSLLEITVRRRTLRRRATERPTPIISSSAEGGLELRGNGGKVGAIEYGGWEAESSKKIEDLLEMVKKLQKAGSLEPRVEVLINRINEVQEAKKKASEELGEARTLWETLQKELDSINKEKVHLKEFLNERKEALNALHLHYQETDSEAQRKHTRLQECQDRISALNSQIEEEKNKQRELRLDFEQQLEDLMDQHKDLWEFHRQQQLQEKCQQLQEKCQRLKEELEKRGVAVLAQAHKVREEGAIPGEVENQGLGRWEEVRKQGGG
ncbi:synaptonemal complex central element protein 1 [Orycteropus afer afer]|uniref:Synaptonemal complex central element protein 1 n=1 Tax=Orycteropus afer afer TaxID=1230840 RepID=A0A8B7B9E3_ORYAF|nr:synaptonemal complex central element protein 1 [Orycteropus afer afer]